jgi:hypothetical protein
LLFRRRHDEFFGDEFFGDPRGFSGDATTSSPATHGGSPTMTWWVDVV